MTSSSSLIEQAPDHLNTMELLQAILNFLTQIFSSLAWPVAILIIFFSLKKPLLDLLPSLRKFSAKGVEIEFVRELENIKDVIQSQTPLVSSHDLAWDPELEDWYNEVQNTIQEHPGYGVALTYSGMDSTIRSFAKLYDPAFKNPQFSSRPMNSILDGLAKVMDISSGMKESILTLENLRNRVLEDSKYADSVSKINALYYLDVATELIMFFKSKNPQGPLTALE